MSLLDIHIFKVSAHINPTMQHAEGGRGYRAQERNTVDGVGVRHIYMDLRSGRHSDSEAEWRFFASSVENVATQDVKCCLLRQCRMSMGFTTQDTERHAGAGSRQLPMFLELRPILMRISRARRTGNGVGHHALSKLQRESSDAIASRYSLGWCVAACSSIQYS